MSQRLRNDILTLASVGASASQPSEVAVSLLQAMQESMSLRMGAIYTYDEPGSRLSLLSSVGMDASVIERFKTIEVNEGEPALVAHAVMRRQAVTSHDVEVDSRREELLRDAGLRQPMVNIALPLQAGGRIVGTLSFVLEREHPITGEERAIFTALGAIVAQAIDNAMMLQDRERRTAALEAARDIAVLASITDTWSDFAAASLQLLCLGFDVDTAVMYLIDDGGNELLPAAVCGFPADRLVGMPRLTIDEDHDAARAYRSGRPVMVEADQADVTDGTTRATMDSIEAVSGRRPVSSLVLPLDGFRQSEGSLGLFWSAERGYASPGIETFKTLAREITTGLENIRLAEKEYIAQQQMCENERRFGALINASSDVLYTMSPDWREMRRLTSEGFLASTDRNPRWLHDYIHGDDHEYVFTAINEAIRTKGIFELEHRVVRADGSMGWTHSRAVPLLDENGEIVEWFGSADDITERKAAERRLSEAMENARVTAHRQSLLKEVAEIGAATYRIVDTAAKVVDALLAGLGARAVAIWKVDRTAGELVPLATTGIDPGYVAQTYGPVSLDSDTAVARVARTAEASYLTDSESVFLPLVSHDEVAWVLSLVWVEPRSSPPDELEFLGSTASSVALGLQNASLFEAETEARREANRELETVFSLLTTAEALREWVSLDDVLAALTESLLSVIDHTRVTVLLWDAVSAEATLVSSAGVDAFPAGRRLTMDELSVRGRELIEQHKSIVVDYDALEREERGFAVHSGSHIALLVPLVHSGEIVGAIGIDDPGERREFTDREVRIAEGVASQAAVAIESARLYEVEHGIAKTLQETLVVLPSRVEGIMFSSAYESATVDKARVGGDFVDVFEVGDNVVGIALGDVSGKGIDAAVTTALIRTTLRVHALDGMSPSVACAKTNEMMRRFTELESYVTLWFGLLNTHTGQLRYVCAGHPPGFVVSADGIIDELESRDPIMGAFDAATFHEWHTVMLKGDRLLLYSDGAIEAKAESGEFLGMEGWLEAVVTCHREPTEDLAGCLMAGVVEYAQVLRDDVAILVVQAPHVDVPRDAENSPRYGV